MFQFLCRFAFFINFSSFRPELKITRILTLYQANAATLLLFSKEGTIENNLNECKGYNARQL